MRTQKKKKKHTNRRLTRTPVNHLQCEQQEEESQLQGTHTLDNCIFIILHGMVTFDLGRYSCTLLKVHSCE